jgi:hypothetical protein
MIVWRDSMSTGAMPLEREEQMYDDAFGYWLSGFTDGEGCFHGRVVPSRQKSSIIVSFSIALRADDLRILEEIRQALGVGGIYPVPSREENWQPQYMYSVNDKKDLAQVIIPHFEKYPLRSKKTRDFVIWKRLVLECKLKCINGKSTPEEVLAEATLLAQQLKEGRAYQEVEWVDYPRPGKGHRKNTPSCPKCGETDPTRFSKRPNDTYSSWCKGCINAHNKAKRSWPRDMTR